MDGRRRGKPLTALGGPVSLIIAAAGAGSLYGWLIFATTFVRPGLIGVDYNAVGSDWMVFHAAATSYLSGHEGIIYDGGRLTDLINHNYSAWLGTTLPFRPWVYPPTYLLLIAPFGFLSFLGSFVAFQILTAMALVAAIVVGAPAGPGRSQVQRSYARRPRSTPCAAKMRFSWPHCSLAASGSWAAAPCWPGRSWAC